MIDYDDLIAAGDANALAYHASGLIGFPVPPLPFLRACQKERERVGKVGFIDAPRGPYISWSEDTYRSWFLNRAEPFRPSLPEPVIHEWLVGTLHVGTLGTFETEEDLICLRNEPLADRIRLARTKFWITLLKRVPINRVALWGTPEEK